VGDSRAVMSRGGKAVDLSSEHRPYGKTSISVREIARIKDAGGWIYDGRVCGILAVSRAFGDMELKRGMEKMLVDGVVDGRWTKQFAKEVKFVSPPVTAAPDVLEMQVCVNPTQVYVNPTQVCVNRSQACVNPLPGVC
jgi:protein phosphatase 1A